MSVAVISSSVSASVNLIMTTSEMKKGTTSEVTTTNDAKTESSTSATTTTTTTTTTTSTSSTTNGTGKEKSELRMAYGNVILTLDNVLIPKEKLNPTPSSLDGLDQETETELRILGCELIQTSGILLKLPQTAMATGTVLFHRFFYSKSFVRQSMETTAMACIYLASKIEEAPRRIRDVINVFHHIKLYRAQKEIKPLILDPNYVRLKSDVTLAERRVLKELGFCVHVKHPHKLIVTIMNFLGQGKDMNLIRMAWNYMNDSLRSNVFIRFPPETIACACIFLSARTLKIPLPENPPWYHIFSANKSQLIDICETILELYERPKIDNEKLEKVVDTLTKNYHEARQKKVSSLNANANSNATSGSASSTTTATTTSSSHPNKTSTSTPVQSMDKLNTPNIPGTIISPNSKSSSPNALAAAAILTAARMKQEQLENERKRRGDEDDNHHHNNMHSSKKSKKSPSPIIYDSPQRHRHKKRKKRYSSSLSKSRSRSRSRERERKSSKKTYRRERSRSPYSPRRHHHKQKKYYKDYKY